MRARNSARRNLLDATDSGGISVCDLRIRVEFPRAIRSISDLLSFGKRKINRLIDDRV